MAVHCTLELLEAPLEVAFEELTSATLEVFFAVAWLEALAPVVTLVATVGEPAPGVAQPLIRATLDPFAQRVRQIGWFTPGETWYPAQVFAPLLAELGDTPPQLLLLNEQLSDAQRAEIATQIFAATGAMDTPARGQQALASDYLWPTLREVLAAWQVAGESSAVPPDFPVEDFRTFLTDRLVPSLWWPEPPGEGGAQDSPAPDEWAPASAQEVRFYLHGGEWRALEDDSLLNVLRHCLMLYGKEVNEHDIGPLAELYAHVIPRTEPGARAALVQEVAGYAAEQIVHAVVLLPVVMKDPADEVVVPATMHFAAHSPLTPEGERYALVELRELLRHRGVANPAAVLAALVAHAPEADWSALEGLGALLTAADLVRAASLDVTQDPGAALGFWRAWSTRLGLGQSALVAAVKAALAASERRAASASRH